MAQNSKTYSGNLSATSAELIPEQKGRQLLEIQNQSSSINIYIAFGRAATTADFRIPPDSVWTAPSYDHEQSRGHTYAGAVNMIAASGTPAFSANVEWVS